MSPRCGALALVLAAAAACKPALNDTVSIVDSPRILAVRVGLEGGHAEARPMGSLAFTALYVDASGTISPSTIDWAFCNERKPLAELEPVSPLCLYASGDWFADIGMGNPVMGAIPTAACAQFGPDVPQPMPGQPQGRPVDPDFTGGFYQPVRVLAPAAPSNIVVVTETRLICDPADAPPDVFTAFTQRYHPNTNPVVASLGVKGGAAWTPASVSAATPNRIAAGQHFNLEVVWGQGPGQAPDSPSCPIADVPGDGICGPDETGAPCSSCGPGVTIDAADCCPAGDCTQPKGCTGAERYIRFDAPSASLVEQREGIAVSWFATGGAFDSDVTGRSGAEMQSSSDNGWLSPSAPGSVLVWVVLRDDRGGIGWQTYSLAVQ